MKAESGRVDGVLADAVILLTEMCWSDVLPVQQSKMLKCNRLISSKYIIRNL